MRKEGLIFDLDGTLVDSLADIAKSINLTRVELGLPPMEEGEIILHVGSGTEHLVRSTIPVADERFDEAHRLYKSCYGLHLLDNTRLLKGVEEALRLYRERTLAIVTNKPIAQTEKILAGLGIDSYFKMVLGSDSLPRRKPDPLPLNHFMAAHGLERGQVVMIGDGVNDVRAGKAAGVMTVGVEGGVTGREELLAEGPDRLIGSMEQLGEVIA